MSSLDDTGFYQLWKSLYDPATILASHKVEQGEKLQSHRKKVEAILSGMTKIVFGVDENKKATAVTYGDGCLELTMKLMKSCQLHQEQASEEEQQDVWRSGLKMCKCCVIRSRMGRTRCRVAGVFEFIRNVLSIFLHEGNASMVEEALTTLSAVCLGDDLNALQGAVQLRDYVDRASIRFPHHDTLHQKTHYLTRLFDVVEQEQASLLHHATEQPFFDRIALAELELRRGMEAQYQERYEESQEHYTRALDELQHLENSTGLLDSLWCELYQGRASVRLKLCQWDGALEDTHALLQINEEVTEAHVLKAKILEDMGKVDEAKKALADILTQLERLNVD